MTTQPWLVERCSGPLIKEQCGVTVVCCASLQNKSGCRSAFGSEAHTKLVFTLRLVNNLWLLNVVIYNTVKQDE